MIEIDTPRILTVGGQVCVPGALTMGK